MHSCAHFQRLFLPVRCEYLTDALFRSEGGPEILQFTSHVVSLLEFIPLNIEFFLKPQTAKTLQSFVQELMHTPSEHNP